MVLLGRVLSSAREAIVGDVGFDADQTEELVAIVAQRATLDPATDLRPAVLVAAMAGAAPAAFRAWVESGGRNELTTMMVDALDLVTDGLAELDGIQVGRTRSTRRRA